MKLYNICDKIALRLLGEPGTLVEVMEELPQICKNGDVFKVIRKEYFGNLRLEGVHFALHPSRFRKVIL